MAPRMDEEIDGGSTFSTRCQAQNIQKDVGITSTPVLSLDQDRDSGLLYLTTTNLVSGAPSMSVHVLNLATGAVGRVHPDRSRASPLPSRRHGCTPYAWCDPTRRRSSRSSPSLTPGTSQANQDGEVRLVLSLLGWHEARVRRATALPLRPSGRRGLGG